jgi:hypothetical protein
MNETDLVMTSLILAMNTVSSSHRLRIFGVFTQSAAEKDMTKDDKGMMGKGAMKDDKGMMKNEKGMMKEAKEAKMKDKMKAEKMDKSKMSADKMKMDDKTKMDSKMKMEEKKN